MYNYLASDGYFNPYIPGLAELCEVHADPLLKKARKTFDPEKRIEIYKELMKFSYEYATHMWHVEDPAQIVHRSWIDGYYFNPAIPGFNLPGIPFYNLSKGE
ncbi:hypothetical protein KGY79_06735 [Candidatus Bipolaricaulota bacterium]|nr:hypothetical protein [Candidatus Bipolaricaulota bacterium]